MSERGHVNAYPRSLLSVTMRAKDGTYLGSSGLASPVKSGPDALDAAIMQLQRYRNEIARNPHWDWHIQINVRPAK